jgi:hypothetical protein
MKKFLLGLLCIGSILALPGCWCRRSCQEPCDYYDDYCDDACDDYCDEGYCEGYYPDKELVGYEEQQGYRKNIYRTKSKTVAPPSTKVMHKPIHPAVIQECEAKGKTVRYLDKRYERHNETLNEQARAKEAATAGPRTMGAPAPYEPK